MNPELTLSHASVHNPIACGALRGLRRPAWLGAGLLLSACVCWLSARPTAELPRDTVLSAEGWVDETRCAECHTQPESFQLTGHARTLAPATQADSLRLLREFVQSPEAVAEGVRIDFDERGLRAVHEGDGPSRELSLGWRFGSGRHAHTWVGALPGSWGETDLVEFRWSWYQSLGGFAITPGQPERGIGGYFNHLGVLFDHPKARDCFACHSSYLPKREGWIDGRALQPGVTCQRCHGPRAAHVASEGAVIDSSWRDADQTESINRCAQCHRRADEQEPGRIRTDNVDIVRFQPVGLVQSACFNASPQLTCLTCHDPHQPLEAQDSLGIWQCVQCHDAARIDQTACGAGQRDDCVRCHMPKVRFDAPLLFTDHWIRVRSSDAPQP